MLQQQLLLLLLLLPLLLRPASSAAPPKPPPALPCPSPTVGGLTYDLASLKGKILSYTSPQSGIKFSFGVCKAIPTGMPLCPAADGKHSTAMFAYCAELAPTGVAVVAADPTFSPAFKAFNSPPRKGAAAKTLGLVADLPSETSVVKFVELKYLCDAKATSPRMTVLMPPRGKLPMGFNITIMTKAACGSSSGGGGGGDSGGKGGGWSTLFFVCLPLSIALYCVAGCFINMRKYGEASVWNACPQRQFWCGLPGLVMDGVAFFFSWFGIGDGELSGSGGGGGGGGGGKGSSPSGGGGGGRYDNLDDNKKNDATGAGNGGYGTSAPSPLPNPYGTVSGAPVARKKKQLGASSGRHNKEMADAFSDTEFDEDDV